MKTSQSAHILNARQVQSYRDDGFLVIEDFLSLDEIDALRVVEASPAIRATLEDMGIKNKTVHMLELTTRHPAFLELARDPRIIGCIEPLLGPDIQLQHSKLATKPTSKGVGAFGWHQDLAFYPHTNTSLLAVFVYLDDATPENGCMSMVRGSHLLGPLNHLDANGVFTTVCQDSSYWEDHPEKVVTIAPRAGAISIHHCLTLHGSPVNLSGRPRRGLVFSYRADDSHQLGGTRWRDTGLVVAGQRRGIVRCESTTWPLPLRPLLDGKRNYGTAHEQAGDWAKSLNESAGV